jgi:ABC-type enterochelin transport system substrate-binding protein
LIFFSRIKLGDIAKKLADIQTKLSSPEELKRKQDDLIAKQQTPLIDEIKRLTPILDKLKQQQQDLLKNIDSKLNNLTQNFDKENELKKRSDTQRK